MSKNASAEVQKVEASLKAAPAETGAPAPAVAETEAVAAMTEPAMTPPGPGEKCQLCDQMYPDDDAGTDAIVPAAATAAVYGSAEIEETLSLCSIAGLKASDAQKFISAQVPVDKVRADLIARRAAAADQHEISTVDPSAIDAASSETRMKAWRETQAKTKKEMRIGR